MTPMRIFAVDDHGFALSGIAAELEAHADEFDLVGTFTHPDQINLGQPAVDVVILDFWMNDFGTSSTLDWVLPLTAWGSKVLLHTSETKPVQLREASRLGAQGLCLKGDNKLIEALRALRDGGIYVSGATADAILHDPDLFPRLTAREVDVLLGVQDGLTHGQIARELDIKQDTVKKHLERAAKRYKDIGRSVTNSASVAREARRDGHLPPD